jgi:uncharacterized protein YbjT (DUF2867 family)
MVRFLITAGNSKTGSATIVALRALGVSANDIFAGSRSPASSESALKALGAGHVIPFDHDDEASIEKALVGIDRVFVAVGATLRIAPVYARVEKIASKSGSSVSFIVGIGAVLYKGPISEDFALAEKHILDSKLASAVVSPNWFFENWKNPSLFAQIKAGTVYGSSGTGKVAQIAAEDIGKVSATVLLNPSKYDGQRLIISGPEALTEAEIVNVIGKVALEKPEGIVFVNIPEQDYRGALAQAGISADWIDFLYELEEAKAAGAAATATTTVKDVTGHEPISVQKWSEQLKKELVKA